MKFYKNPLHTQVLSMVMPSIPSYLNDLSRYNKRSSVFFAHTLWSPLLVLADAVSLCGDAMSVSLAYTVSINDYQNFLVIFLSHSDKWKEACIRLIKKLAANTVHVYAKPILVNYFKLHCTCTCIQQYLDFELW